MKELKALLKLELLLAERRDIWTDPDTLHEGELFNERLQEIDWIEEQIKIIKLQYNTVYPRKETKEE